MIEAGHTKAAIRSYTVDETKAYLAAIVKRERDKLKTMLAINLAAARGDKNVIDRLTASLSEKKSMPSVPEKWIANKSKGGH